MTVLVNKNGPIRSGNFCPGGRRELSSSGVSLINNPYVNEGDLYTGTMHYGGGGSKCGAFKHFNGAQIDISLHVVDLVKTGSGVMYNMIGATNTQTKHATAHGKPVACLQQQFYTVSSYGDGQSILKPQHSGDFDYARCSNGGLPQPYGYYCTSSTADFLTCRDTAGCISIQLSRLSAKGLAAHKAQVKKLAKHADFKKCLPLGERQCGQTKGCAYCAEKTSSGDYNSACCAGAMGEAILPCKDKFGATLHKCNA